MISALSLAALLWTGQEPPRFATSVDAVYVDVFVTEHGRPVTGLSAGDFEVRDDGTPQKVDMVALESFPLAALLVFDASDSVAGATLAQLKEAGRAFVTSLAPGDRCGLLTFNHELSLVLPLTGDRAAALRALDGFSPAGSTALMDAVYAGLMLSGAERLLMLVFTDGRDNLSWLGEKQVLAAAEQSSTLIQVVGVTAEEPVARPRGARRGYEEPEYVGSLRRIAEATGGRFWTAASPARLKEAFLAVLEAMRTRYILRFEPTGVSRSGVHELDVRLRRRHGEVHARRSYVAPESGR